ncbi:MAG: alpha/beta hydrolase [Sphaerochaetaceae bacterium]|jgi:pimeloyl-ACP methyl ester carboxylesterase|nr:alpha/beta hydrolase [Sphaerochaetaceae bacterium]
MLFIIPVSILIVALLAFILIAAFKFIKTFTTPRIYDYEHEFDMLKSWGFDARDFLQRTKPEEFSFQTSRRYVLRGNIFRSESPSSKYVIVLHGYTSNQITVLKVCEIYRSLGFNVITYDHRWHGVSDKTYVDSATGKTRNAFCSLGYYEAMDLIEVTRHLQDDLGFKGLWGLHGESMGAGTIMMASDQLPSLDFIVEDCGYATLKEEMYSAIQYKMKLPGFPIVDVGNLILRIKYGFWMSDVKPIDHLERLSIPALLVHGDKDSFVPTSVVYKLYEAKKDNKAMHIFKDCVHAKSAIHSPDEYTQVLRDFLDNEVKQKSL